MRRRYQDFVWLKTEVDKENPSAIVPPIPEKQRLDYMDRFSPVFIEKRQAAFQRFFDRIASHPTLHKSEMVRLFLESKPAAFETLKQTRKAKAFTELGDSLMNGALPVFLFFLFLFFPTNFSLWNSFQQGQIP